MTANELGIGLDISTVSTGVFRVVGDALAGGTLLKEKGWQPMATALKEYLGTGPLPDYVAIEGTYLAFAAKKFGGRTPQLNAFEPLVGLRYIIMDWLEERHIPYYVGQAAQINAACGVPPFSNRKARKLANMRFARTLGWEVPEDVADALCVLWWGRSQRQRDRMIEDPEGWAND